MVVINVGRVLCDEFGHFWCRDSKRRCCVVVLEVGCRRRLQRKRPVRPVSPPSQSPGFSVGEMIRNGGIVSVVVVSEGW